MKTRFVCLTVPLQDSPIALRNRIESCLQEQGEPLRWAVTSVDSQAQTVEVEAVVTVAVE